MSSSRGDESDDSSKSNPPINEQYPPSDYTVGWICAIPIELEAAIEMLDSKHGSLKYQPHYDTNHYRLGSIGDHMVVITCLPLMGKVSATTTASYMKATFPHLRFRLMVGIGGGIPSAELDIRLGDVAVSKPSERHGGVVEYDFGRWEVGGFRSIGSMNRPPTLLLNLIPAMISRRQLSREIFMDLRKIFTTPEVTDETWFYPGSENDVLFQADYSHIGESRSTCVACHSDKTKYVARDPRPQEWPRVHYGTIASGDSVVKNTKIRDWLGGNENAICVEMEAAGLMNDFPSLVIRGISDYADSHKNSKWQPYASAVAAVYARKLLQELGSSAGIGWNPYGINKHWDSSSSASPYFTGREDELSELQYKILGRPNQRRGDVVILVIQGKAGVGKGQLWRRFASKARSAFWGIFRIDGSSTSAIKRGLVRAVATATKTPEVDFQKSKNWFEKNDHGWLLILENVVGESLDISELLPSSTKGNVIITTCNPKCARFQTAGTIELGPLDLDGAIKFLLKISGIDQRFWAESFDEARRLVTALRHDTLGIALAGSLISSGLCTLKQYLNLYWKQEKLPMSWELQFLIADSRESYIAFKVSKEAMRLSKDPECADAIGVLSTLAWLHNDNVPDWLFETSASDAGFFRSDFSILAAAYHEEHQIDPGYHDDENHFNILPKWLLSRDPHDTGPNCSEQVLSVQPFRRATRMLSLMSFITINTDNGEISISPSLHLWARKDIERNHIWSSWVTAITIVTEHSHLECKEPRLSSPLQPHIEHCARYQPSRHLVTESSLEMCKTHYNLALCLSRMSFNTEALRIASLALSTVKENEELQKHVIRCSVTCLLGIIENNCRRPDKAILHLQEVLAVSNRVATARSGSVPTFPEGILLNTKYFLACLYLDGNETIAALPLLRDVVTALASQSPPPPLLLRSQDALARGYLTVGKPEETLNLLRSVIQQRQKDYKKDHPILLRALLISAEAYMAVGKLVVASTALKLVTQICSLSPLLSREFGGDLGRLSAKLEALTKSLDEKDREESSLNTALGSKKDIKPKL